MLFQLLALANFALSMFDCYVTRRRIRDYGVKIEVNRLARWLSTRLGPEAGTFISVLGPLIGWVIVCNLMGWVTPLAILLGVNIKRADIQLISVYLESQAQVKQMLEKYKVSGAEPSTLHGDAERPPKSAPVSSKEDVWKYSERKK